jgi:hypothetical protein
MKSHHSFRSRVFPILQFLISKLFKLFISVGSDQRPLSVSRYNRGKPSLDEKCINIVILYPIDTINVHHFVYSRDILDCDGGTR